MLMFQLPFLLKNSRTKYSNGASDLTFDVREKLSVSEIIAIKIIQTVEEIEW